MLLRKIYPLKLREKISYKLLKYFPLSLSTKDVELEFDKNIKLDLSLEDVGHKSIMYNGFYELELTREMIKLADKGGLLLDVGANYGYFSCLWANRNIANKVMCFEASPDNIKPLRNNIEKNNLGSKIHLEDKAVGIKEGKMKFDLKLEQNQTGWGGLTLDTNANSIEVDVVTLTDYCRSNHIDQIEVLKIDVEGADTWVLYGAEELLKNKVIKHIFYEQNLERMEALHIEPKEAEDFLKGLGYSVRKISFNEYYAHVGNAW